MLIGGVEAGGTKFICAIYDSKSSLIRCKIEIRTTQPEETIKNVFSWFEWAEKDIGKIDSIGLGLFGPLDLNCHSPSFGCIKKTPKSGWKNINFIKIFYEKFGIPLGFNTDVNSAVIGEGSLEALSDINRLLYITIGTGIGVGMIHKGQTLFDDSHLECGHMILPKLYNDKFSGVCPYHSDCWEGLCSGPAIAQRTHKTANQISGDDPVWEITIEYISIAISNIVLSLCPEKIIIGGGVRNAGLGGEEMFFRLLRTKFKSYVEQYSEQYSHDDFIISPLLGDESGIHGAFVMGKIAYDSKSDYSVITNTGKI